MAKPNESLNSSDPSQASTANSPPQKGFRFSGGEERVQFKFIQLENLLTHTKIIANGLPVKPHYKVEIIQVLDEGIEIEMPHRNCVVGHNFLITLSMTGVKNPGNLEITAKVVKNERIDGAETECVEFKWMQYDVGVWNSFRQAMNQRQNEAMSLLDAMRGFK